VTPRPTTAGRKPPLPDEQYLHRQRELFLTTSGRRTGRPHRVKLWFASAAGRIYLMAYTRRHGRGTDWFQNLRRAHTAVIEAGERRYAGHLESVDDAEAELTRITEMFAAKYGRQMVNSYYTETKRFPVRLAITPLPQG